MNIDVHSKIRLLNYCETEFGEYGEYATNAKKSVFKDFDFYW